MIFNCVVSNKNDLTFCTKLVQSVSILFRKTQQFYGENFKVRLFLKQKKGSFIKYVHKIFGKLNIPYSLCSKCTVEHPCQSVISIKLRKPMEDCFCW